MTKTRGRRCGMDSMAKRELREGIFTPELAVPCKAKEEGRRGTTGDTSGVADSWMPKEGGGGSEE